MSGIAGLWRRDGAPLPSADLERLLAGLAHRGLDSAQAWRGDGVALARGPLPPARSAAPPLTGTVVVADLRLDDRAGLAATLGLGATPDDARLVLAAYARWGEASVERLLGDFAFALWDPARRALVCARDALGVRPLYYHLSHRLLAFASEPAALLAVADIPPDVDEARVADYLLGDPGDTEATFRAAIRRLPPAHVLVVEAERVRRRRYWAPDAARELRLGSDAEYAEAFREAFTLAVRERLPRGRPAGSLLSGGLDSSAIVGVARHLLAQAGAPPLHTFSATFEDVPACDERPWIAAVVEAGPVVAHYVRGDRLSPSADLDAMLAEQGEPFWAPHLYLHRALYAAADEAGVRYLLDGFDGDTVVSHGLARLAELARSLRWLTLAREVRGVAASLRRTPREIFVGQVVRPLVPHWLRRLRWALAGPQHAPGATPEILGPALARRIDLPQRLRRLRAAAVAPVRTERQAHAARLGLGLIPLGFEVADRTAARRGVEPRYPFFDRRLVELCLSLPAAQKLGGGHTRAVMRRGLAAHYPPAVRYRGHKSNLGPLLVRDLQRMDPGVLERLAQAEEVTELVDVRALLKMQAHLEAAESLADAFTIWRGLTVALWLTRLQGRSSGSGGA